MGGEIGNPQRATSNRALRASLAPPRARRASLAAAGLGGSIVTKIVPAQALQDADPASPVPSGGFPDFKLMLAASVFSCIAALHLSFCHFLVYGPLRTQTKWFLANGGIPALNWHWFIMTFEWFLCIGSLLVWSHRHGSSVAVAGNWLKMLATMLFFVEDFVGFAGANAKFLPSFLGIFFFTVGGVVHVLGFSNDLGWYNTTTVGILCLCVGAGMLMIFFHIGFTLFGGLIVQNSAGTWTELNCVLGTMMGDGLMVGGSFMLLGGLIDILGAEQSRSESPDVPHLERDKDMRQTLPINAYDDILEEDASVGV